MQQPIPASFRNILRIASYHTKTHEQIYNFTLTTYSF